MIAITYAPKYVKFLWLVPQNPTPMKDFALFLTPLEFRTEKKWNNTKGVYTATDCCGFLVKK